MRTGRNAFGLIVGVAGAVVLGGCSRVQYTFGAALGPGDSATVRLLGGPTQVEIANTGNQSIDYSITEDVGQTSGGSIAPGGMVGASRHKGGLTVRLTNAGPGEAEASIEARSSQGVEFTREPGVH